MRRRAVLTAEMLALASSLNGALFPQIAHSDTSGCTIVAKGEVWLRIFQETENATPGAVLMQLHLQKDEQYPLMLAQFIYDWKVTEAENYHNQTESRCRDGDHVLVP